MRIPMPLIALPFIAFAPANVARAGGHTVVAEIVRFEIIDGMEDDTFLNAAKGTQTVVSAAPGFISRQLSKGDDGVWTDYILWQNMAAAKSAAETVVKDPAFGPFGQAIKMESILMRHENVLWRMVK